MTAVAPEEVCARAAAADVLPGCRRLGLPPMPDLAAGASRHSTPCETHRRETMPKRDPDLPPPDAYPLGEAFRRFSDLEIAAALKAAEEEFAAAAAAAPTPEIRRARAEAIYRILEHGLARLRAGEWIAWGREGSPTSPLRRLPAEAWELMGIPAQRRHALYNGADIWAGGVVKVANSPIVYYAVVVCPAATQARRPSRATVRVALAQAQTKKGKPLTQDQAVTIGLGLGASRAEARAIHAEMSPTRGRAPRAAKTAPKSAP